LKKWYNEMDIYPEDEILYTMQYQQAILKYVENEYSVKHRRGLVNKLKSLPISNSITSAKASGYCQSSFVSYDLSSHDEKGSTPNNCYGPKDWRCGRLHSFRYKGEYAGTSEGHLTHLKKAGVKVLEECMESVMVWG
jgi:hypothetical protein